MGLEPHVKLQARVDKKEQKDKRAYCSKKESYKTTKVNNNNKNKKNNKTKTKNNNKNKKLEKYLLKTFHVVNQITLASTTLTLDNNWAVRCTISFL